MTDTHLLKYYIRKNGDTVDTLADYLKIKRQTLSAKINNRADFKQSEMRLIKRRYNIRCSDFTKLFLGGELL